MLVGTHSACDIKEISKVNMDVRSKKRISIACDIME